MNSAECRMQNISSSIQLRQRLLTDKLLSLPVDTQVNHRKLVYHGVKTINVRIGSDLSERAL